MTREEKIEILIEDRIWEWVYAYCLNGLKDMLRVGFKGFDNYTNKELDEALGEIKDRIGEIKRLLKRKPPTARSFAIGHLK